MVEQTQENQRVDLNEYYKGLDQLYEDRGILKDFSSYAFNSNLRDNLTQRLNNGIDYVGKSPDIAHNGLETLIRSQDISTSIQTDDERIKEVLYDKLDDEIAREVTFQLVEPLEDSEYKKSAEEHTKYIQTLKVIASGDLKLIEQLIRDHYTSEDLARSVIVNSVTYASRGDSSVLKNRLKMIAKARYQALLKTFSKETEDGKYELNLDKLKDYVTKCFNKVENGDERKARIKDYYFTLKDQSQRQERQ